MAITGKGIGMEKRGSIAPNLRVLLNRKQEKIGLSRSAPGLNTGNTGDMMFVRFHGGNRLYIKTESGWYFTPLIEALKSAHFSSSIAKPPLKQVFHRDVTLAPAHSGDNTVIALVDGILIPRGSIVTMAAVGVKKLSNLATHDISVWVNTARNLAIDASVASNGTEILGEGVDDTDSTDSASKSNISVGTSAADENETWVSQQKIRLSAANDSYVYIANAGTGNGTTTASTSAIISLYIEYVAVTGTVQT